MPRLRATGQAGPTSRTRGRRLGHLVRHDLATIAAILDAGTLAHVGYVVDGAPVVTPTLQWRDGGRVYWHGSAASRMLRQIDGAEVCLTVSLFDGYVLARSGLEHTVSYRSAMLFGRAEAVRGGAEKARLLKVFSDRLFPGRWDALRPLTAKELKATAILSMPIDEASAKISTGMPDESAQDRAWPVWAGLLPARVVFGPPVRAADCDPVLAPPRWTEPAPASG